MARIISTHTMHEEDTAYALPNFIPNQVQIIDENTVFIPLGVTGNAKANTIFGNAEANRIDGGVGQDTMTGGAGDDTYFVDDAGDVIVELANGGIDTVNANVSYTLSTNVENLALAGSNGPLSKDNINGTGNALDNHISGNYGSNRLLGLEGNDTLMGGMDGVDTLEGGSGDDVYYADKNDIIIEADNAGIDTLWVVGNDYDYSKFKNIEVVKFFENNPGTLGSTPAGPLGADGLPLASKDSFIFDDRLSKKAPVMKIEDFDVKADTLCLSKLIFKKIAKKGDLSKAAFYTGPKAHDANDRIIYNKKTGVVSYDADGNGGVDAIKFAKIDAGLKMAADNFFVI
ncbi:MAG: calcium-binding protein [Microvirga sp.]